MQIYSEKYEIVNSRYNSSGIILSNTIINIVNTNTLSKQWSKNKILKKKNNRFFNEQKLSCCTESLDLFYSSIVSQLVKDIIISRKSLIQHPLLS